MEEMFMLLLFKVYTYYSSFGDTSFLVGLYVQSCKNGYVARMMHFLFPFEYVSWNFMYLCTNMHNTYVAGVFFISFMYSDLHKYGLNRCIISILFILYKQMMIM